MPFFTDRGHYQAIAHLLLAGDIQARVVSNEKATSVEVKLEDGTSALWSNTSRHGWSCSTIDKEGVLHVEESLGLAQGEHPEAVAAHIANHPYESAPERVSSL